MKMSLVLILLLSACGDSSQRTSDEHDFGDMSEADMLTAGDAGEDTGEGEDFDNSLPIRHVVDATRAARGENSILELDGPKIPWQALRNLWVVWGQTSNPNDTDYWAQFAQRYGFVPREGQAPWGIERRGGDATLQCMTCHVDKVAAEVVIGGGNSRLQLQDLYDDLLALRARAAMFGITVPEIPEIWATVFDGRTGAPGAIDAFGMGMTLGSLGSGIETHYGFQQPPSWWTMRFKDRTYTDGAGSSLNHRTMIANSLSSGATLAELQAKDEMLEDVKHYLLSLEPPAWPFEAPARDVVDEGRQVFLDNCASCHGVYDTGSGSFPDTISDVGTDPVRHSQFGQPEATWINASWFGQPPMIVTDGYLAPPLVGVWAAAPYLHNGSIPDLRSLLRPSERPATWRHTGDYDPVRVGVSFTTTGGDYDTSLEGLSNQGHTFGEDLTEAEITALLAYLVKL